MRVHKYHDTEEAAKIDQMMRQVRTEHPEWPDSKIVSWFQERGYGWFNEREVTRYKDRLAREIRVLALDSSRFGTPIGEVRLGLPPTDPTLIVKGMSLPEAMIEAITKVAQVFADKKAQRIARMELLRLRDKHKASLKAIEMKLRSGGKTEKVRETEEVV